MQLETVESKLEYLRSEIDHKGIYRVAPNEISLPGKAPNSKYTWQFYLRRCLFNPQFVTIAADLLIKKLNNTDVQIGACEDAGVPLGMAMSMMLNCPMISIKKSRKEYGLLNFTEGVLINKPILLVDDLAGSQNTFKKAINTLCAFKLSIADEYVALVNKTQATHANNYIQNKKLVYLFSCENFNMSWNDYFKTYGEYPDFGKYV